MTNNSLTSSNKQKTPNKTKSRLNNSQQSTSTVRFTHRALSLRPTSTSPKARGTKIKNPPALLTLSPCSRSCVAVETRSAHLSVTKAQTPSHRAQTMDIPQYQQSRIVNSHRECLWNEEASPSHRLYSINLRWLRRSFFFAVLRCYFGAGQNFSPSETASCFLSWSSGFFWRATLFYLSVGRKLSGTCSGTESLVNQAKAFDR